MNIEYYRNFVTVVETGNISEAAKKIHIAQPALTSQIKQLEEKFGTKLIKAKKGMRRIVITDAGLILYKKASYICDLEKSAESEIESCSFGLSGTLRLNLSPSSSISFIQNYLSDFAKLYPNINYELFEVNIATQTQQLLNGFTEIGVANAPLHQPDYFDVLFRTKENLTAVFKTNNPWINPLSDTLTIKDIKDVPICLSRGCADLFKQVCIKEQISPRILSINSTKLSTAMWAKQGIGVAVIPLTGSELFDDNLSYKVFNDNRLRVDLSMVTVKNRSLSPVAEKFIEYFAKRREEVHLS